MTVDNYGLLADACSADDIVGAQRLLRWGPFDRSGGMCSPASPPSSDLTWIRVERLNDSPGTAGLSSLLALLGHAGTPIVIAIGAGAGESPTITLGVHPSHSPIDWVRSIAAPAVRLRPVKRPSSLDQVAEPNQGGLTLRLGLGTPPPESGGVPLLETLLTIPDDRWCVLFALQPSDDGGIDQALASIQHAEALLSEHLTRQEQLTATTSIAVTRSDVQRTTEWMGALQLHAATARASGGWLMGIWVGASTLSSLESVAAAIAAATSDLGTEETRWTLDRLSIGDHRSPPPTSFVSNEELGSLFRTPASSVPTVRIVESVVGGRRLPESGQPLVIGSRTSTSESASIDVADLEGHAFISGTTGSGKSTTLRRLLSELWNRHGIPFLVIDPVKDDYASLSANLSGGLSIIRSRDLRLNVLEPWSGSDRATHVDAVAALFKGAFSMPSPIPYVVDRLFRRSVTVSGWRSATLHDLADDLDGLVTSLGYSAEVESNIRAALGTRLALLLDASRAEQVAAPDNRSIASAFDRPTVITLADTADPDARGFLMASLALLIGERSRSLGSSDRVRHVTVLEEAHVVLPEPKAYEADSESGSAASAASRILTGMLAEIRSFGEALVVVDQSPSVVARQVVRNTNLKIAHRILDPVDREVLGGALGLDDETSRTLVSLDVGEAILSSTRLLEPVMVSIEPPATLAQAPQVSSPQDVAPVPDIRLCCSGHDPATHHVAEGHGRAAEDVMSHFTIGMVVGDVSAEKLRTITGRRLDALSERITAANRACFAFVGLRRTVSTYVRAGFVPAVNAPETLDTLWNVWNAANDGVDVHDRFNVWLTRKVGPYSGCVTCSSRCLYRVFATSAEHGGTEEARRFLPQDRSASSPDRFAAWAKSAQSHLEPWIGLEAASAVRCATVQALHSEAAAWATIELTLASLIDSGDERFEPPTEP